MGISQNRRFNTKRSFNMSLIIPKQTWKSWTNSWKASRKCPNNNFLKKLMKFTKNPWFCQFSLKLSKLFGPFPVAFQGVSLYIFVHWDTKFNISKGFFVLKRRFLDIRQVKLPKILIVQTPTVYGTSSVKHG